jgi:hypothetical protein
MLNWNFFGSRMTRPNYFQRNRTYTPHTMAKTLLLSNFYFLKALLQKYIRPLGDFTKKDEAPPPMRGGDAPVVCVKGVAARPNPAR